MPTITQTPIPSDALHAKFRPDDGFHTDCFEVDISREVNLPQFVEAFYTTPLFRCERLILRLTVRRPSTDTQAHQIAHGEIAEFAAWNMEERNETQLLMQDMHQSTRSWFMIAQNAGGGSKLRFGSVVSPKPGTTRLPTMVRPLMGLHRLYSRFLLKAAARRLLGAT